MHCAMSIGTPIFLKVVTRAMLPNAVMLASTIITSNMDRKTISFVMRSCVCSCQANDSKNSWWIILLYILRLFETQHNTKRV
jgi:hypothetical protein